MKVTVGSLRPICKLLGKRIWDEGVWANGDEYYRVGYINDELLADVDCFFQFNIFNPYRENRLDRAACYRYILNSQKPYLVWEEGNFRQYPQYKKFGWWSYQASGRFNNQFVDAVRWRRMRRATGVVVKDWHSPGSEILIMGQLDLDSALIPMYDSGIMEFKQWVEQTIAEIRKHTDRTICVRPHPLDTKNYLSSVKSWNNTYQNVYISSNYEGKNKLNGGSGLYADLAKSYCVVTYNSNSIIEAVCAGVPVFALSQDSSAWDIAHHSLDGIENLDYSIDVTYWCHQIAYTLWTKEEVRKGETWAHLKPVYFK
jgi:hypothetical protein